MRRVFPPTYALVKDLAAHMDAVGVKARKSLEGIPPYFRSKDFDALQLVMECIESPDPHGRLAALDNDAVKLNEAMDELVDVHYAGFHQSIKNFSAILSSVERSQEEITGMLTGLAQAKQLLLFQNDAITRLYVTSLQYKETVRIYDSIAEVLAVPDELVRLEASGDYLSAVKLLNRTVNTVYSEDLAGVAGLHDLARDMVTRKHYFHETLIDELHNCIYNPLALGGSEGEAGSSKDDATTEASHGGGGGGSGGPGGPFGNGRGGPRTELNASSAHGRVGGGPASSGWGGGSSSGNSRDNSDDDGDSLEGSEAERLYSYRSNQRRIRSLVEAIVLLDRAPTALRALNQRLGGQLHAVFESAAESALAAYFAGDSSSSRVHASRKLFASRLASARAQAQPLAAAVLPAVSDRFLAVLDNHEFVLSEFTRHLGQQFQTGKGGSLGSDRGGVAGPSAVHSPTPNGGARFYTLDDVWSAMQLELQMVLREFLDYGFGMSSGGGGGQGTGSGSFVGGADADDAAAGAGDGSESAAGLFAFSVSREASGGASGGGDGGTSGVLGSGDAVGTKRRGRYGAARPGGSSGSSGGGLAVSRRAGGTTRGSGARRAHTAGRRGGKAPIRSGPGASTGEGGADLRSVVPPSPYNITAVYAPLMWLIEDVAAAHPGLATSGEGTLQEFLAEFVSRSFARRLRADLLGRAETAMDGPDAFRTRDDYGYSRYRERDSARPLLYGAVAMAGLLDELRTTLSALPDYTDEIIRLMQTMLLGYWDKCQSRFLDLVSGSVAGKLRSDAELRRVLTADPLWAEVQTHRRRLSRRHEMSASTGHVSLYSGSPFTLSLNATASAGYLAGGAASVTGRSSVSVFGSGVGTDAGAPGGGAGGLGVTGGFPDVLASHGSGHDSLATFSGVGGGVGPARLATPSAAAGENAVIDEAFLSAERTVEDWLYKTRVEHDKLIGEPSKLAALAALCDSMEWLSYKIDGLGLVGSASFDEPSEAADIRPRRSLFRLGRRRGGRHAATSASGDSGVYGPLAAGVGGPGAGAGASAGGPASGPGGRRGRSARRSVSGSLKASGALAQIPSSLEALALKFRALSDNCLLTLRMELRVTCFSCLAAIEEADYATADEPQEPDFFIVDLNKTLAVAEDVLSSFIPPVKTRYLFEGLARLISSIFISSLSKIEKVNLNGVERMCRNVFALQQNLTNIIVSQERHFDRVRQYYGLLRMDEDELLRYVGEHRDEFTLAEYKQALALISPNQKPRDFHVHLLEQLLHDRPRDE